MKISSFRKEGIYGSRIKEKTGEIKKLWWGSKEWEKFHWLRRNEIKMTQPHPRPPKYPRSKGNFQIDRTWC